jgi:formylmethanofuran--tetrahydromethanopterin N-formyltransferase
MSKDNNKLEILGYDDKLKAFNVKAPAGNTLIIQDTFAEMFPLWAGRILITGETEKWALTSATVATGFAVSIIMSPAEAGIECTVPADQTPDKRPGALIQIYNRDRFELKHQFLLRIGQCILTCPTTKAFNGLMDTKRKIGVGRSLRFFGDGFEKRAMVVDRKCWKIPVMEGSFYVEDAFGVQEAVAGGNFMIFGETHEATLKAAEAAVEAIRGKIKDVVLPFPGGIARSGSKAGSMKYKLNASTSHTFCPSIRDQVPDTVVPPNATSVLEIVINGLSVDAINNAMKVGVPAACLPGIVKISAGNYGGKLGPFKANLKDAIGAT